MKEMHFFKTAKTDVIKSPEVQGEASAKLLLEFLYGLGEWTQSAPLFYHGTGNDADTFYVLYRDFAFTSEDFCQTFEGYIAPLLTRWQTDVYGTAFPSQEAVLLTFERDDGKLLAIQKTVSGEAAEIIHSLCLSIRCESPKAAERLNFLCAITNWKDGMIVADWKFHDYLTEEQLAVFSTGSCFCYGNIFNDLPENDFLGMLNFEQKKTLWLGYLKEGFDYVEFEWLYGQISARTLENRIEWELALDAAMHELGYSLKISGSEFEIYDGSGKRKYFNFDSYQYSQRAFLKMLFPVNI